MPPVELRAGDEIAGYRIVGLAGRGGMGVVYRATDVALDRPVALKLISDELASDESFRERFRRESRVAASIRHPHVITVFAAGEADGVLYIAMDYIDGTDLRAMLTDHGRLEPRVAALISSQVASALDAAHANTLVHRDVKPANVLIAETPDGPHAYLTDFGLTKNMGSTSGMTETGAVVGTLDYIAPEQIEGAQVDARADVYSLGCMLYETLTGSVPFPRDSSVAKMYAHLNDPAPSATAACADVPAAFEPVLERAMAKRPEDRYPSAGDLGRAALAAVEGSSVAVPERTVAKGAAAPAAPAESTPRRSWLWPAVAIGAAVAVVAVLAVALSGGGGGGDGGGSSSAAETPPASGPPRERLLAAIPESTRAACQDADAPAPASQASLACDVAQTLTAVYHQFADRDAADAWYRQARIALRVDSDGDCTADDYGGEVAYNGGRYACYISEEGFPSFLAVDEDANVALQAEAFRGKGLAGRADMLDLWECCIRVAP